MGADVNFESLDCTVAKQVATIKIKKLRASKARSGRHWELATMLSALRRDEGVRVIVLTGAEDGVFSAGPRTERYDSDAVKGSRNDPVLTWKTFQSIVQLHEEMAAIEKPIVAKVNGEATTLGSSLVFGSDLVVAREDALIADFHLGMGADGIGSRYGLVPGDGGAALVPLHMPPMKAKEYLMLAKQYTAKELAAAGYINYAVPAEELDRTVDDLVDGSWLDHPTPWPGPSASSTAEWRRS